MTRPDLPPAVRARVAIETAEREASMNPARAQASATLALVHTLTRIANTLDNLTKEPQP